MYEVIRPPASVTARPVVVHIPHSSVHIPKKYRRQLVLTDTALDAELLAMTDHFTDRLFESALRSGATLFVNRISRLVMDPERFPDDQDESMSAKGMGAVYLKTSSGERLRRDEFGDRDRQEVMDELYRPYAAALQEIVAQQLARSQRCLIIDAHSFPSRPLPYEDPNLERPDICLGFADPHAPNDVVALLRRGFEEDGVRVTFNQPFAGSYVPSTHYLRDPRVKSVMVEVNRSLYLDERNGTEGVGYSTVAEQLERLIGSVVAGEAP